MATPALFPEDPSPSPFGLVEPKKKPRPDNYWLHGGLFVVTLISTTLVGMRYADNFNHGVFPLASSSDIFPYVWIWHNLSHFALGLPFACTLLAILLTHEFGHYFACRFYGVRATLPYMLPAPSLSGTAGAVIRLKSRIKSRSALIAIGAFGPISGFVVAVTTATIGLAHSLPVATEPTKLVRFSEPLLIRLLLDFLNGPLHMHLQGQLLWHPVFIASWIGILITSLNLIPAGQLDGGHILYSISPKLHKVSTYIVLAALVILGVEFWLGWLLWAALLMLPGMRHPRIASETSLPRHMLLLAPIALTIFLLSATYMPFNDSSLMHIAGKMITQYKAQTGQ